jgi:hypothetical protein
MQATGILDVQSRSREMLIYEYQTRLGRQINDERKIIWRSSTILVVAGLAGWLLIVYSLAVYRDLINPTIINVLALLGITTAALVTLQWWRYLCRARLREASHYLTMRQMERDLGFQAMALDETDSPAKGFKDRANCLLGGQNRTRVDVGLGSRWAVIVFNWGLVALWGILAIYLFLVTVGTLPK